MSWVVACERVGVRREQQLAQPAAELRQVGALARRRQQHLADHLVDMRGVGRLRRLAGGRIDRGTERRSRCAAMAATRPRCT